MNVDRLCEMVSDLHPVVHDALKESRTRMRENSSKGTLPNFEDGEFVLVARADFTAGEKLSLRWRGPHRVLKAVNYYFYQVEDLRNGVVQDTHASRMKFYRDASLDAEAIMSHVVSSETGMEVQRLLGLVDTGDGLMVQVRWKGLPDSEDTKEPLRKVHEDVLELLVKLLRRKIPPTIWCLRPAVSFTSRRGECNEMPPR